MRGTRLARKDCRVAVVALFSFLAASCSSTSEPTLQLADPSFTASGAADTIAPDAAAATAVAEGDSDLPAAVAALPTARPGGQSGSVVAEAPGEKPAATASAQDAAQPASSAEGDPAAGNGEAALTAEAETPPAIEPKKKSFLSSFFGSSPASPASKALESKPKAEAKPLLVLASAEPAAEPQLSLASLDDGESGGDALPGVRQTSLFEITHKSGIDDDSDIDLYEEAPSVQLASAAGLARLAPNGLLKQRESVDVGCLKPSLVRLLKTVERHFGKRMVVTSGYRSPSYNRKVNGARRSQHMHCAAVDVQLPGVSKWELARYVRALPGRGGVGTYCHTESVHIDVGPERDWNWKCRRRKT